MNCGGGQQDDQTGERPHRNARYDTRDAGQLNQRYQHAENEDLDHAPLTQALHEAEDQRETEPSPLPPGAEPIEQSLEMARLAAEIERRQELMAKRPKRKFVSASTREYEYAAYLRAWVAKVERVGTLNYPDDARRRGLGGRLVMTVAVRRDGTVEEIVLNRPSGLGMLDQAASRIVRLAEPFPPLPQTAENIDVLHITRTWDFQNGSLAGE